MRDYVIQGIMLVFIISTIVLVFKMWRDDNMIVSLMHKKSVLETEMILNKKEFDRASNRAYDQRVALLNEITALKEHAKELASLQEVSSILSTTEIETLIKELYPSSPFDSSFRITSRFGEGQGYQGMLRKGHLGNDLVPSGSWYVRSMWPGIVEDIGIDKYLGKYIYVQHSDNVRTLYAHLQKIYYTALPGEEVSNDTKMGVMGDTGYSSGSHLHWAVEIFDGEKWIPIDGMPWLRREE